MGTQADHSPVHSFPPSASIPPAMAWCQFAPVFQSSDPILSLSSPPPMLPVAGEADGEPLPAAGKSMMEWKDSVVRAAAAMGRRRRASRSIRAPPIQAHPI
ncbi:hypothetical protein CLOM_g19210 [Closterium sp. NIES-68]|nr:hypothetical protein CLOM_g19210 [Closterium sp. NIES-68]